MTEIRPLTHERLRGVADRWRRQEQENEALVDLDPTGQRFRMATVYRQCANDLDLALRDDLTVQPQKRRQ